MLQDVPFKYILFIFIQQYFGLLSFVFFFIFYAIYVPL